MTLSEFLLARLAEDEAVARRCADRRAADPEVTEGDEWRLWDVDSDGSGDPVVAADPARVLADVEAKRRIVEWAQGSQSAAGDPPGFCLEDAAALTHPLRILATVFADHPDYRDEWKP